ncbi:MAG: thiamine pyrophosphate-binding protein [Aeromicrobium sp.]|uniref:thiamine pyrophosphate-binding protein n=1 Tax=Aeromicrobium sp. TaxID=1871063 RepID=UPI00263555C9|nr:thiamine pyrophosphate-binding protein [Aeromicrobium sp.]MDF1706166.1 thiamine pyrophosphate-binding protein [Aeromicrobium sp.]
MTTVHAALGRGLLESGVEVIFGLLGDANLFAMDSYRAAGGRFVDVSHESGAVLAAVGYAQRSGALGVASVTHGPALSNTVTALIEGVKSRSAVLVVAGDTAVEDLENVQNIPQRELVVATGAGFVQARSPRTVLLDLSRAMRMAVTERRPVVLNVPSDLTWQEAEILPVPRPPVAQAVAADDEALDVAAGILASAQRPVILAGRGAALSAGARAALDSLALTTGAPVATTVRGKDFFRGHEHDLGIFGSFSTPEATATIAAADVVVAFGAGLNSWTTYKGELVSGKRVVQVDTDAEALGRWTPVTAAVVGDVARVATQLDEMLTSAEVRPRAVGDLADRLARERDAVGRDRQDTVLDLVAAARLVDETFAVQRTAVFDVGRFWYSTMPHIHVQDALAHVHTVSSGSIGLSVPCAIGASFAAPGEPVLVVVGDGGFMLGGLAELSTAVRHGCDLTILVVNDKAYGAEWVQLDARDVDPAISTFDWPDFAPVAEALGATGLEVSDIEQLRLALDTAAKTPGTTLIDLRIDPSRVPMGPH